MQIAQNAQLAKIVYLILFDGFNETGALPPGELARPQMKDPQYILTAVSAHVVLSSRPVQWSVDPGNTLASESLRFHPVL